MPLRERLDGVQRLVRGTGEEDRRRDFALVQQGYLVLRITYRMIMRDWQRVMDGILALVRRDEHRWRAGRVRPTPGR
ncbi:very-short-patch-repair endonuclease [Cryobacterium sp. MP_M5]|nr:very-short-patch-repair endonuclease [Cryobacterium sp. MP_M5]